MSYMADTRLEEIKEFPGKYLKALADMGVNTVEDLQRCQVEMLAQVVYEVKEVKGGKEDAKLTIGVGAAGDLLKRFAPKAGVAKLPGQYVYRAATSRTLTLQHRGVAYMSDGAGGTKAVTTQNPIHIKFEGARGSKVGAMLILTEQKCQMEFNKSLADMKALVEAHDQFNKPYGFRLVAGPEADALIASGGETKRIIQSGVRGTGNV